MEGIIKHEGNNSYLIMKEGVKSQQEEFLLRMMMENRIPGLLKITRNQINGEGELFYHINGYISLAEYCEKKPLGQQDLKNLLLGLKEIMEKMEEYLLDGDRLVLQPEFLFFSTAKNMYAFCFYPFTKKEIKRQIQDFGEYLLNHINHEDEKVVRTSYQFYRLTRQNNFEIRQVAEELLRDLCGEERKESTKLQLQTDLYEQKEKYFPQFATTTNQTIYRDERTSKEKKEDRSDIQSKQSVYPFFIYLSVAGFFFFLYTCILKNYFYGYSFFKMLATTQVQISLATFLLPFIITLFLAWQHKNRNHKEIQS